MGYKSPRLISQTFTASLGAWNDSTTYYVGTGTNVETSPALSVVHFPKPGIITAAQLHIYFGSAGSGENVTILIRKNNTTDYAFTTGTFNTNMVFLYNYALNIPMTTSDYVEFKIQTPAWATNPANGYVGTCFMIECE